MGFYKNFIFPHHKEKKVELTEHQQQLANTYAMLLTKYVKVYEFDTWSYNPQASLKRAKQAAEELASYVDQQQAVRKQIAG